jgi:hypothetical protein
MFPLFSAHTEEGFFRRNDVKLKAVKAEKAE